ncbi:hypothetical protein [Lysinibacillus sp. 54212]|uniref:hypothetical protein n=1 Tax=Lysinibacillus sp. 54212 TaxID=3119829 RepID=UPI002FC94EDA
MKLDVFEICHKESEELISVGDVSLLNTSVQYVEEHPEQFLYIEASPFNEIKIDALVLEFDEAFKKPMALFGLKLQKKFGPAIQAYLKQELTEDAIFGAMFSGEDGLWEINLTLDGIKDYEPSQTIQQSIEAVYNFVDGLMKEVEVV